jgi:hypothetical protein
MIFIDIHISNFTKITIPFDFSYINGIQKFSKIDSRTTTIRSSSSLAVNDISNLDFPEFYIEGIDFPDNLDLDDFSNVINSNVSSQQMNMLKGMFSQMRQDKTADSADDALLERWSRLAGL